MKYSVDQLEGDLLDAAVAKAEGAELLTASGAPRSRLLILDGGYVFEPRVEMDAWSPSTKWEHGGPIIERQRISVTYPEANPQQGYEWHANIARPEASFNTYGPTPLIAAMRAYVASRFGEKIDLP